MGFGFRIVVVSVLLVAGPSTAVWISDFGCWILDFVHALDFAKDYCYYPRLGSADLISIWPAASSPTIPL